MSFTSKFPTLPPSVQQEITAQYTEYFPFEVRYILADDIEKYGWGNLNEEDPQHAKYTDCRVKLFLEALRNKCTQLHDDPETHYRLQESARKIEAWVGSNPFRLANEVQRILSIESNIISQFESSGPVNNPAAINEEMGQYLDCSIDTEMERLKAQASSLYKDVENISHERSQLLLSGYEFKRLEQVSYQKGHQIPDLCSKLAGMQNSLYTDAANNRHRSQMWLQNVSKVLTDLKAIQHRVIGDPVASKLAIWKREQQLANNGRTAGSADNSLERIQGLCGNLSDLLCQSRKMLCKFQSDVQAVEPFSSKEEGNNISIKQLADNAMNMVDEQIISLIKSSFIIEKQPPQVMKTNIRFVASVALLTGNTFNVDAQPPDVYAYIINEYEASQFLENPRPLSQETRKTGAKDAGANEILNNKANLEHNSSTGQVVANFRNMQLKRIKRTEKKGTESVMDEKFAILFTSSFRILNGLYEVFVWTLSLPVVVIVHGNQEPHAWATITWDNAFAEPSRKSFKVTECVPWHQLAEVLNMKFKYYVSLPLQPDDLMFLAYKVLRRQVHLDHLPLHGVTWNLFAKDNLPERPFTFWEWFFAILKVSRDPLKIFFQEKSIIGFLSRQQTEELLLPCPTGTFLLRFSDSELGGVTIAWVGENQDGVHEVFMVQPFTARDFAIRGLADRIGDLKHLTYLYPNIPKDQVFGKYYSQDQTPKANGYVKPVLALTLLGYVDHNQTPHPADHSSSPHPLLLSHRMNNAVESPSSPMSSALGYMSQSPESATVSSMVTEYMT